VRPALRLGPLDAGHRNRVAEILRACGVFREDEVVVALELFDEAMPCEGPGTREPSRAAPPGSRVPDPDYRFLGSFDESGELRAFSCHGPTPGTDRTYDLYWIAVDPALQGGGGGTTLLAEVERELAAAGARMLVVETSSRPEYVATRAFYARRGYTEAARVGAFYAPGDDRVIFTKRLPGPAAGTER
jgi:ribosomal protein S18 acetylase RimI-like enzyme